MYICRKIKFWYQIPCTRKNAYSVLQIYPQLTMHLTVTLLYLNQLLVDQFVIFNNNTNVQIKQYV